MSFNMKTQKGYILPIVLIVILLTLAGFFIFSVKDQKSPVAEEMPVSNNVNSTTTLSDVFEENSNNQTATTSGEVEENDDLSSDQCLENSDCPEDSVCYFKPGGNIGACTGL